MNEFELMLLMCVVCIVSLAVAIVFAIEFNILMKDENERREAQTAKEREKTKAAKETGCKHSG